MKKLKIAVWSRHGCIRALKQAHILANAGHELYYITESGVSSSKFKVIMRYEYKNQLLASLKLLENEVDIYHIHNEPSYAATMVRETIPDAKIIFDMHDSQYWRYKKNKYSSWYEEDVAVEISDGIIFNSETCKKDKKSIIHGRPCAVVPSAVPISSYEYGPWIAMGGLVSQGGHSIPGKGDKTEYWRDYTKLYAQLIGKKQVYAFSPMFTGDPENKMDMYYENLQVKLAKVNYDRLLTLLGNHDWNLVGNLTKSPVWDYVLPNKIFDALAAGIPSVNFGCKEVAKLIDEYDIGINVESVEELLDRWDEHKEKRKNVLLNRKHLSLDKYIGTIEKLYKQVLE